MSTTDNYNGRLANQIIRNIAVSLVARNHNLHVTYSSSDRISALGIKLFCGNKKYFQTVELTDDNYFTIKNAKELPYNVDSMKNYFQTPEISQEIHKELINQKINIESINPFRGRYNKNNDCFIHIRLGDVAQYNPGLNYYLNALSNISYTNLFIGTDSPTHQIINDLITHHPKACVINVDEVKTIQFGSTCRYVVLSHGSFSAVIGYLSFYSSVYYPSSDGLFIWFGDMFSGHNWTIVKREQT